MNIRFIGEWEPQDCVIISWPTLDSDWGDDLPLIEETFIQLAEAITPWEPLIILCQDEHHRNHLAKRISNPHDNITLCIAPHNHIWVRDYGPLSINIDTQLTLVNCVFNGWGNRYHHDLDNDCNDVLAQSAIFGEVPFNAIQCVLEGGNLETDGQGTLIVSAPCLYDPRRNPKLTTDQIDSLLKEHLGINRIIPLENTLLNWDDTDGHADTLVRFTDPHTLCYLKCDDKNDPFYDRLNELEKEIKMLVDYQGNPYRLLPLPLPQPIYDDNNQRLPTSYANFLILNGAVLVPQYQDPIDEMALNTLRKCFPNRTIIGLNSTQLIKEYGSIHCATMQIASPS